MVAGGRRRGGPLHEEMAQGRGQHVDVLHMFVGFSLSRFCTYTSKCRKKTQYHGSTFFFFFIVRNDRSCGKVPVRLINGTCAINTTSIILRSIRVFVRLPSRDRWWVVIPLLSA